MRNRDTISGQRLREHLGSASSSSSSYRSYHAMYTAHMLHSAVVHTASRTIDCCSLTASRSLADQQLSQSIAQLPAQSCTLPATAVAAAAAAATAAAHLPVSICHQA